MENAQNTVHAATSAGSNPAGSNLAAAVDRLDSALKALEGRVRELKARSEGLTGTDGGADMADVLRLQDEVSALKAREKVLEKAASGAFEALGVAAKDIRQILSEQAA